MASARIAPLSSALLCGFLTLGGAPDSAGPHRSSPTPSAAIWFDTSGGDAWTFNKEVMGRTAAGACDEVWVRASRAEVRAFFDGRQYIARVPLREGPNSVVAVCLKDGREVDSSSAQRWTVRLHDEPRAWIRAQVSGNSVLLDAGATTPAPAIPAPIVRYQWIAREGNPAPLSLSSGPAVVRNEIGGKRVAISAPKVDGRYYVTLRATDAMNRTDSATAVFRVARCRPLEVDTQSEHPSWLDDAVLYGVALPLFAPNAFVAVTNRLENIERLGATALWLSPVTEAPDRDFGYAVSDPFRIRRKFGSPAELRTLISKAHRLGLHVILDVVVNHLSDHSGYFADTQARGARSPYYDWFERDASGHVAHYFNWRNLENLNYDHPEVRSYLTAALSGWLRAYGVDGFRIDAAWTIRQRAPELWPEVRRELERIDPDIALLAEASVLGPYYARHGFDAAYDWSPRLGEWAWQSAFGARSAATEVEGLRAALARNATATHILTLRFLDDNDTGKRFLTLHGIGETRLAAALLFTLPGIPLIYDGDESGAAFEPYAPGASLTWNDAYGLTPLYTRLARLRHETAALRSTQLTILHTDRDDAVLTYARGLAGADPAIVLLNFSSQPLVAKLDRTALPAAGTWVATNLQTAEAPKAVPADRKIALPRDGAVLLRDEAARAQQSRCMRGKR